MKNNGQPYHEFIRYVIFWGRITMFGAFILSFLPVMYLALFHGILPSFSHIITSVSLIILIMVTSYVIEPISYFPIVGVAGSYMCWLAGNISNLRVPVSVVSQAAGEVKEGTHEGDIISTLGIGVSVFINLVILVYPQFLVHY